MFCPYKKYELPKKDEINQVKLLVKHKYYYPSFDNSIFKKILTTTNNYTLNNIVILNSLYHKAIFDPDNNFEYKCEHIFNLARYSINQSLITKTKILVPINYFVQIPINQINKCSHYNDFIQSLNHLQINFNKISINPNDQTAKLYYDIHTDNMVIFDDYKPESKINVKSGQDPPIIIL